MVRKSPATPYTSLTAETASSIVFASSGKLKACTGTQIDGCLNMGSDRSGDLRYVGAGSVPATASGNGNLSPNVSPSWHATGMNRASPTTVLPVSTGPRKRKREESSTQRSCSCRRCPID